MFSGFSLRLGSLGLGPDRCAGVDGLSGVPPRVTVDEALLEASGILEYEKVQIVDVENGSRFETYTIAGEENSGMICLNGAAARMVQVGDHIILMAYADMTPEEAKEHKPKVVFVDEENKIKQISTYEKHGQLM